MVIVSYIQLFFSVIVIADVPHVTLIVYSEPERVCAQEAVVFVWYVVLSQS